MSEHNVIVGLMQLFMGCFALALILTGLYYFTRKWINNNPICDRCHTRGVSVEAIRLVDSLTSFKICQECSQDDTIRHGEDAGWALILQSLYRVAQSISGYDIIREPFWPKDKQTKKPLTIDEIVDVVLYGKA